MIGRELESVRSVGTTAHIDRSHHSPRARSRPATGQHGQLTARSRRQGVRSPKSNCRSFRSTRTCDPEVAGNCVTRKQSAELVERKIAADDALKHIDLRARRIVVHDLGHTVGGVITAGNGRC